jgi:hypothetical protein
MTQPLIIQHQVPSSFTYNNQHSYKIELTEVPLHDNTAFDFVWNAIRVKNEVAFIISTWKEPQDGETLCLNVCLINILANSPCLLLTSHVITVVREGES